MSEETESLDLWRRFVPLPTQQKFLTSTAKYRLMSSGYGSGKSKVGCRESIRHALMYPQTRHLVARKTSAQLERTTKVTYFRELDEIGLKSGLHFTYNAARNEIVWVNGSVTLFSHLDDPTGATYGSLEITTAFIDEGSEVADSVYRVLFPSRLRWHTPTCEAKEEMLRLFALGRDEEAFDVDCDCPLKAWICTNPGASGYLMQVVDGEMDDKWKHFPVPPFENPFNGPEWKADMERLGSIYGETWKKRYIEGDWTAFEGQRFPMFSDDIHLLKEDETFTLGERHKVIEGWDFGYHETFVVWIAYDEFGEDPPVAFAELQSKKMEGDQIATRVREIRQDWDMDVGDIISFGDPAGRAKGTFGAKSPIQFYSERGIYIAPCDVGKMPQARADLIASFLSIRETTLEGRELPGLMFSRNCPALIKSVRMYAWDTSQNTKGEDPQEKFLKKNDHGVDALGYGLIGVMPAGTRPGIKKLPVALAPDVASLGDPFHAFRQTYG